MERDLFEVYYQPVYSTETHGYITLEALSRLWHPDLGSVPPDVFISIAERNDWIARISLLQFRRVCAFLRQHREELSQIQNVKFNLSPAELMKAGHSAKLVGIIQEYGLDPRRFQFEITETVATQYSEELYQSVSVFQEVGIGLCLDDFGSGYANLNTVLRLPFSVIKLDRSLLMGIDDTPQVATFYQSIVKVIQDMGYHVVAEGVETAHQLELVRKFGVTMIQGYYFSKPQPQQALLELLQTREGGASVG
jgi:EAL domain-containing protein (putative c-di-GMP-specific phosphodiesterase class I)